MAFWRLKEPSSIIQLTLIALGIATGTITLIVVLLMTSKYAPWRHQQPLLLKLQSFSITNLNTSNSLAEATFDTKLLLANQNTQLEIFIPSFESLLFFNHSGNYSNGSRGVHPISCTVVEAVHLGPKRQRVVEARYDQTKCGGEQPFVEEGVLEEMRRDGEKGVLGINVGLDLRVKYRTGILFWDYELKPKCPTLRVRFAAGSGVGWLDSDVALNCSAKLP